ncbi:putative dioxygenase [Lachnellula willkommii]|uniref:Putative dioxygenase n=1 Tax=Lachnellula willkommii TaxID=215461 RepID=A0A559MKZ1_9HELO|nr:putative dioxygenase [Lachnellula willkommii]
MSPSRINESSLVVTPIKHAADKKCTIGAIITGLDLNDITDEDLSTLKEAIHQYQYVTIKDQHNLDPVKHWELVTRLDPEAPQVHGHGTVKEFQKTGGLLSKRAVHGLPAAPNVRLIGKGYQGEDHFGIKDFTAAGASNDYHRYPPSAESFAAGNTQFQRWHRPDIQVNWDDGSGLSMKCKPGQTAFVSNTQLYELLSDEEKMLAENSWVEYAPFPYMWIENCKGRPNGLGLETEGKEHKMEEMPEWEPEKIKTYPMVWMRPNGKKALQIHGIAVRKMFLKATLTSEVQVVDDVVKIRKLLHSWQQRIIRPEYVLMGPVEEGDVQMWDNWSVFHTAVDYPDHYGSRSMHQANLGASDSPVGPVPIPVS